MSEVTQLLSANGAGDPKAADQLLPLVYEELLAVNDALAALALEDAQAAEVVQMRYFVGMSVPEIADALNLAPRTVDRHWAFARAWLKRANLTFSSGASPRHRVRDSGGRRRELTNSKFLA